MYERESLSRADRPRSAPPGGSRAAVAPVRELAAMLQRTAGNAATGRVLQRVNSVPCAEVGDGDVYFQANPPHNETDPAGQPLKDRKPRKPPMCHIIPYQHLLLAYDTVKGMPEAWRLPANAGDVKRVVWHPTNLRPGHSVCNAKTVSQGRSSAFAGGARNAAISFVQAALV